MSDKKEYLYNLRHSAAHLLAHAVLELYPDTKVTIGPVTETGFFYDFLPATNFKEEDLLRIEKKMRYLVKRNYKIIGTQVSKEEALELFKDNQFKKEIIETLDLDADEDAGKNIIGIYRQGDFYDLCKGGHVSSTGEIKHFKLTGISGSYWRANRDGVALQRITGIAFATKEDLDKYLQHVEDAKMYDHRRLGKQLDLFSFHDEAPGMPFFHGKGTIIYNKLIEFMRKLHRDKYEEIRTPIIMNESLWKQSGHYDFYKDKMYFVRIDNVINGVRPMNCPGGLQVYKTRPRSYRELPLRIAEFGLAHRHELSGVMHGLFRVRAFTIDDAHIYCTPDQVKSEIVGVLELAGRLYSSFGFKKVTMMLATRPEKSMGSDEIWDKATIALRGALEQCDIDYIVDEGGGAFYGPKVDIKIEDSMGREWQCGTIQIDFNMPINFKLEYIDSDQSKKQPVMIHRAIYGSIERFMGILLEHFKGRLPFFIAPVQVRLLTITKSQEAYAISIQEKLLAKNIRVEVDLSGDKISAQIRRAQIEKIPCMVVLGQKEQDNNTVTMRDLDGKQQFGITIEEFLIKTDDFNKVLK